MSNGNQLQDLGEHSIAAEKRRLEEMLAKAPVDHAILQSALLDYLRANRRAKLAEVAAIERFERAILTTQRASQAEA